MILATSMAPAMWQHLMVADLQDYPEPVMVCWWQNWTWTSIAKLQTSGISRWDENHCLTTRQNIILKNHFGTVNRTKDVDRALSNNVCVPLTHMNLSIDDREVWNVCRGAQKSSPAWLQTWCYERVRGEERTLGTSVCLLTGMTHLIKIQIQFIHHLNATVYFIKIKSDISTFLMFLKKKKKKKHKLM